MADNTYWHKQTASEPLFPDLLWSRPENKNQAGKLLIIGGNKFGFVAPATAYQEAENARIGSIRMILPDSLKASAGKLFGLGQLVPSTPSGSIAKSALASLLEEVSWADGVLLSGDFGRNSETAILLEKFAEDYKGIMLITQDALDFFTRSAGIILDRPSSVVVASLGQLQKLAVASGFTQPITLSSNLTALVEKLHEFSLIHKASIMTVHNDNYIVAHQGAVSTTTIPKPAEIWRVATAAHASVWLIQNPAKPFEALTTSLVVDN